jgi:hypothetical protein
MSLRRRSSSARTTNNGAAPRGPSGRLASGLGYFGGFLAQRAVAPLRAISVRADPALIPTNSSLRFPVEAANFSGCPWWENSHGIAYFVTRCDVMPNPALLCIFWLLVVEDALDDSNFYMLSKLPAMRA